MNWDSALDAHAQWKVKLRGAISAKEQVDAATLSKDNCCPFGKWLHGDAKAKYGHLAPFGACVTAHATFHREAGRVAQMINSGKFGEAEAALGAGTPYANASSATGVAIVRLKKELAAA
jgi:methyl-accepting chemotaxis protein